jgi:hypothetical protein
MRALMLTVVASVLGGAVVGCGGASMALDPVASAATNTEKAGAISFTFKEAFGLQGQTIAISGHGVADLATHASQMSFDMTGLPAAMTKNGTTGEAEQIGTVIYLKMPFLQGQIPGGKAWIKLDLAQAARAKGVNLGPASSFNFDPKQSLQELLASGDAKRVGTETVQGEQMTHYHAVLDPANIAHVPTDQRAAVERALKAAGISRLPVDVWVDSQHMLRREKMTMPLGAKAHAQVSVDLSPLGSPVQIAPPAGDQVFDATQIAIKGSTHAVPTPAPPGGTTTSPNPAATATTSS